jgi:hypothetical protein
MEGDGHCFYRALAHEMNNTAEEYLLHRTTLLSYMTLHAGRYLKHAKLQGDLLQELPAVQHILHKPQAARTDVEQKELREQFLKWLQTNVSVHAMPVQSEAYGGAIHAQAFADLHSFIHVKRGHLQTAGGKRNPKAGTKEWVCEFAFDSGRRVLDWAVTVLCCGQEDLQEAEYQPSDGEESPSHSSSAYDSADESEDFGDSSSAYDSADEEEEEDAAADEALHQQLEADEQRLVAEAVASELYAAEGLETVPAASSSAAALNQPSGPPRESEFGFHLAIKEASGKFHRFELATVIGF